MAKQATSRLNRFIHSWPVMIDNLPQPVLVMDKAGTLVYANKTAGRALGYSSDELLDSDIGLLLGKNQRGTVKTAADALLGDVDSDGPSRVMMLEVANKDGVQAPVNATLVLLRDDDSEAHVLMRLDEAYLNLSRQQIAKLQLASATDSQELMSALDIIEDPIVIFDDQWRYVFVNEVGWTVLGRKKQEVLGRVVWELMPHLRDSDWKKGAYKAMATGRRVRVKEFYNHSGFWYETNFYPSKKMLVALMKNITEAKKMKQLNDQLMDALEQAMSNIPARGRRSKN